MNRINNNYEDSHDSSSKLLHELM